MTKPAKNASKAPAPRRRPRRSAAAIRAALVDAAMEEFSLKGYAGARTAEIARRASVVEPLLFKYFGSKANLFQIAVFETLDRNYTKFTGGDDSTPSPEDWADVTRSYIAQQQEFLRDHSRMFMSLLMRETFEADGATSENGLQEFLDKMSTFAAARLDERTDVNPKLLARISFGALLASALLREVLFPRDIASEKDISEAVIDFVIKGSDIAPR